MLHSIYLSMVNGHVMRDFSKISQIIGQFGQIGQIDCQVIPVELSAHILSLCVRAYDLRLFLQKTMILRCFLKKFYLGLGYEFRLQRIMHLAIMHP